jgi:hypothetical protein
MSEFQCSSWEPAKHIQADVAPSAAALVLNKPWNIQVEDNAAELAALGLPMGFGKHTVSNPASGHRYRCALHHFAHTHNPAEQPAIISCQLSRPCIHSLVLQQQQQQQQQLCSRSLTCSLFGNSKYSTIRS